MSLTLFASMLGVMTSLAYGVYQVFHPHDPHTYAGMLNDSFGVSLVHSHGRWGYGGGGRGGGECVIEYNRTFLPRVNVIAPEMLHGAKYTRSHIRAIPKH